MANFKRKPPQVRTQTDNLKVRPSKEAKARFHIDRLQVSLDKATFVDYNAPVGESAVIIFSVKGPMVFKDVSDLNNVVDSVSASGGFKQLLNNLLGAISKNDLIKSTGNAFESTKKAFRSTREKIKKKINDILP